MATTAPRRRRNAGGAGSTTTNSTVQAMSITASLLRTKEMMAHELDRVAALDSTINEDGALLNDAKEEHLGMGGTMKGARGVMKRLGRQDVRDAMILRCAIVFYWFAVVYVLWSRIKIPFLP